MCYLAVGPKSSGNRLIARILMAAGCHGYGDVRQPKIDELLTVAKELGSNAVAVRSFPHGSIADNRHWPDLKLLTSKIRRHDYYPSVIVVIRDFYCTTHSQPEADHVHTVTKARANTKKAYVKIFTDLQGCMADHSYIYVTYEGLALHPQETINWLLPYIGLPAIKVPEEITDENIKWYKRGGIAK
jgi:hypothetical protein